MSEGEFDYTRFAEAQTFFTNQHNISFNLTEDLDNGKYDATVYAAEYTSTEDCICGESGSCVCNWHFEYEITGEYETFKDLALEIVKQCNQIIRCKTCERTHLQYKELTECTSCTMQKLLDSTLEVKGTCPVCYENIIATNQVKLKCSHCFCKVCVRRLPEPKLCPLCREPVDEPPIIAS